MNSTTEVRTTIVADAGPVAQAALILAEDSTLRDHVTVTIGDWTTEVAMSGDIPFELWGSGTQALWRLLSAIAYTAETVSLYEVVARCDSRNRAVVAAALTTLCGGL